MKLRVLIVEDDKWQLKAIKYFLAGIVKEKEIETDFEDVDSALAHSASEARHFLIDAARNSIPFDLMLLDLGLPEQTGGQEDNPRLGLDILKLSVEKRAAHYVIVVSGHNDYQQVVLPAARLGAADMVFKPYEPAQLIQAILRSLKNKSSPQAQVFFSYSKKDKDQILALYDKLMGEGLAPWMDVKNVLPGEIREFAITKAIQDSDFVFVFLSSNSVTERGFLQKEMKEALSLRQERLDEDIHLIPVLLEPCEVPESLRKYEHAKIYEEGEWEKLLQAIQEGLKRRYPSGWRR